MSRIDEALRRARTQRAADPAVGPDTDGAPAGSAPIPSPDVFSAPWDFPAADSPTSRPEPEGAFAPHTERQGTAQRGRPAAGNPPQAAEAGVDVPVGPTGSLVVPLGESPVEARHLPPGPMAVFKQFDPRIVERLVVSPTAKPASVEQYRKLGGTLHHAQMENSTRVVMVSSAMAGEGKTLTATNVALTLSESYRRRVLLVDADLRQPTLHEVFQVPNLSGLGDGLRSDTDQRLSLIQVTATLSLLTAGRPDPDPMSGLSSPRMHQIIQEAAASFDWVIIDTPPVGLLPDANLLAAMVDTTLLVIQAGETPFDLVQKTVDAIGRDRIIGVVLNRAEEMIPLGYHGKYHRYYGGSRRRE